MSFLAHNKKAPGSICYSYSKTHSIMYRAPSSVLRFPVEVDAATFRFGTLSNKDEIEIKIHTQEKRNTNDVTHKDIT